jgi:DNA (cytosine-5)-methyltransferase 1
MGRNTGQENVIAIQPANTKQHGAGFRENTAYTVDTGDPQIVAHTTGARFWQNGFGTLRGRSQDSHENIVCGTLDSGAGKRRGSGIPPEQLVSSTLNAKGAQGRMDGESETFITLKMRVRRLMPVECERLQGFPDGYTDIIFNGKPVTDGHRYKALGNSMAIPVVKWIGNRITMVDKL